MSAPAGSSCPLSAEDMACHLCFSASPGPWAARLGPARSPHREAPRKALWPLPHFPALLMGRVHPQPGVQGDQVRCWWQTGAQCRQRPLEGLAAGPRGPPELGSRPPGSRGQALPGRGRPPVLRPGWGRPPYSGSQQTSASGAPSPPAPDLCGPLAAERPSAHPESFADGSPYSCDGGASFTHFSATRLLIPNLGRC